MAFALPSFNVAANYRLTPTVGGIAGQVPGYKPSTVFTDALKEAAHLKYAAAAQLATAALPQVSAVKRREMLDNALMDRLEYATEARQKELNTVTKPQRMAYLSQLLAPSGGGQQSRGGGIAGPLNQLLGLTRGFDALEVSDSNRLSDLYKADAYAIESLPGPIQSPSVTLPASTKITAPTTAAPELTSMKQQADDRAKWVENLYKQTLEKTK